MKKNLTKKLMLSVLTLAFAVVSLGASTFAWFTTSKEAQTEEIQAQVIGGSGIELGVAKIGDVAPTTYYINELPASAIKTVMDAAGFEKLNHVSGLNSETNSFNEALYDLDKNPASNKDYIAFRVFVKVNAAGQVVLNNVNVSTESAAVKWNAGVQYNHANDDTTPVGPTESVDYSVLNAVRVAVVQKESTIEEGVITGFAGNNFKVYEQAAGAAKGENSVGFSKKGAYEIYNAKTVGTDNDLPLFKTADVPNWACATFADTYTVNDNGTTDNEEDDYKEFGQMADGGKITVSVERDEVIAFDVYLWVEGYDAECVNAIFAQYVSLVLGFNWVEPTI
ncbi:MAG: hypothetical protein J6K18_02460 [Bacilli bacterium]|nr:hypothetical protein [Bacilli bacterium]